MRRLRRMRSGLVGLRFRLRRSLLYIVGRLPLLLEHDPEKWNPVFPKSMPSGLARGIMLHQNVRAPIDSI